MEFTSLHAGALVGHEVERRRRLLLEDDAGPVGSVMLKDPPEGLSTVLEAAGVTFEVHRPEGSAWRGPKQWTVTDAAGGPIAEVSGERDERVLALSGGAVTWSHHGMRRPHYRVEGLFSANRRGTHRFVPGLAHKVFTAEITDDLVARPDAVLLTLLAAWLTDVHIGNQVATDAQTSG